VQAGRNLAGTTILDGRKRWPSAPHGLSRRIRNHRTCREPGAVPVMAMTVRTTGPDSFPGSDHFLNRSDGLSNEDDSGRRESS